MHVFITFLLSVKENEVGIEIRDFKEMISGKCICVFLSGPHCVQDRRSLSCSKFLLRSLHRRWFWNHIRVQEPAV